MTTRTENGVLSHRIGTDGLFVLRVHFGDIRIRGIDGEVATVRAADGQPLEGLEIEPGERSLAIRSPRSAEFLPPDFLDFARRGRRGRARGLARDLQVEIPAGATLVVEGASADLDVRGMHGDQRYRSASGDLVLADVRGSLTIEAVSGDVEIDADGPAKITARTVSGDLTVRAGSIPELQATTTSGDLRVAGRFDGEGPYAIETVSGDATLSPVNDVRVEAKTITGDIDSDRPARREDADGGRVLIVGAGGPTITFRSTSGDLRVVAAMPPGPAEPPSPAALPAPAEPPTPAEPRTPTPLPPIIDTDDPRLGILRELERGEIDVEEAGRRLEELDLEADAAAEDREDA
jgi:Toastrack DUF4097